MIGGRSVAFEIALRWMSMDFTDDKLTLIMVMAWCVVAPSHYLSQCWPRSMLWYAITRPQRIKDVVHPKTFVFVLNSALVSANFTYIIQGHFTDTGAITWLHPVPVNTFRSRQDGRRFADDTFKRIFLNEKVWILIKFHWSLFLKVQLTIFQHWFR